MTNKIIRNILLDEPSNRDLFHGGGHERTAYSLSKAIVKFDEGDSAIGLDGSWGSGKSSVVEMASRKLADKNGKGKKSYHFFTFDIWKSQGSDFRRSYLEHFISWAKENFPKQRLALIDIESQVQGKTRTINTNNQPVLDWYGIGVLVFLPFLPLYYLWAKKVFDALNTAKNSWGFLSSAPFLLLVAFVVGTLLLAGWKLKVDRDKGRSGDFKSAISRLLLISSRQHQDHTVVQKVREIDPNDYEFHATLREILGIVQTDKDRVVVVLDNIDRLPGKEIKEYWALVRSIFSRTPGEMRSSKNTDITAIVPYDRKLIEVNVNEEEGDSRESVLSSLASRELFSKTFDEVLTVAPPVLSNAREFFFDRLEEALPKQVSTDDRFRAYRIFCELLSIEGGTTTPRQIVSFVNDLSSLYELHDGKFALPTVAAYIAHQDRLTENPAVLNDKVGLNQKISSLTADEKLVQNLAAMVFNVEEGLAFQILLDDEIAAAIVVDKADALVGLSTAPGFDDRIDDVVRDNVDEWRSTGEFGTAIGNIATLLETYDNDAKGHVADSMLREFERVEGISVKDEGYVQYLPVFTLATPQDLPSTVGHFIVAAFNNVHQQEEHGFLEGRNLAQLIATTNKALTPLHGNKALHLALGLQTPPSTPEFMFGLATNIESAGFDLSVFRSVEVKTLEETEYFEEEFVKRPSLAIKTLNQFKANNLLTDDEWLGIANACLSVLMEEGVEQKEVGNLLEIVAMTSQKVGEERRGEIKLGEAITKGDFFRNVGEGETESSKDAQANLLFLAQEKLGETLSNPLKRNPNGGQSPDVSGSFEAFKAVLEGEAELKGSQVEMIAQKAIAARCANQWIDFGKKNLEHESVSQIVLEMFTSDNPPCINLRGLLLHFPYLEDLLKDERLTDLLRKYGSRLKETEIHKVTIDILPEGFVRATHTVDDSYWDALHVQIEKLLKSVEYDAWPEHIEMMDHTAVILIEKLGSSGCDLEGGRFRTPFVKVVKNVLSGQSEIDANEGALDTLLAAIDPSYHEAILRTFREEISNVTSEYLTNGMKLFPELIANIAQSGNKIMKPEKDNVVRHLLVPALEGRNPQALRIFIDMGHAKLKDFQNASVESTSSMLDGAWKSFKEGESDRELIREVSEVLYGKSKTVALFDPTSWLPTREKE